MSDIEKDLAALEREDDDAKKAPVEGAADDDGGEYVTFDDDGDEGEGGDERLSAEQRDPEDREAVREARRKERREKRERQRQARDANRATIDILTKRLQEAQSRLEALEGRTIHQEAQSVDARLSAIQQRFNNAEAVLKDAISRGDGDLAARAIAERDAMTRAWNEARSVKQRIVQQAQAPKPEPEVDPRVVGYAEEFMSKHSWIDLDGKDEDSVIATAIDNRLAVEGYDPQTSEYWDELEKRLMKRLPHRFEQEKKPARQSGPPLGSGREAPAPVKREVYISPERKQAMIAAGAWDDPVKRKRMLKRYADYDKQNAAR